MYCTNYEKTISTLQELRKKDSQFDSWLDERLEKPETGHLDLGMLMIAPVQRIPRYRLLLLDLIKNTWEDHEDYNYLCNASKLMEDVAEKVNESISVAERMNKVLSIKSKVTGIPEVRTLFLSSFQLPLLVSNPGIYIAVCLGAGKA
jgi:hypothetical protein